MATIQIGGLPEVTTTADSDIFHISASGVDKRITKINYLKSYCEETVVSTGNTYTATEMYNIYRQDVTSGSSIITLNAPTFCPCNVHVVADGTTAANTIKLNGGSGIYVNGLYANNATGGIRLSAYFDGGTYVWRAIEEETAILPSGLFILKYNSLGKLKTRITASGGVTSTFTTPIYSTVPYVVTFPVVYISNPILITNNATGTDYSWLGTLGVSTTGQTIIGLSFQNAITLVLEAEWEGAY